MPAYAIDVPKRSVRVFASLSEAMNTANVGEQVIQSAANLERQGSYDLGDLAAFYRDVFRDFTTPFPAKADVARAIFAKLPGLFGASPMANGSAARKRAAFTTSEVNPFQESDMSDLNTFPNNPNSPVETSAVSPIGLEARETAPVVVTADVADVPHTAVEVSTPVASPVETPDPVAASIPVAPVVPAETAPADVMVAVSPEAVAETLATETEVRPEPFPVVTADAVAAVASEAPVVASSPDAETSPALTARDAVEVDLAALTRARDHNNAAILAALARAQATVARYTQAVAEEGTAKAGVAAQIAEVQARYSEQWDTVRAKLRAAGAGTVEAARVKRELADLDLREAEELAPLKALETGTGPAALRKVSAERELSGLIAKLAENGRTEVSLAQTTLARIEALEHRTAEELAPPAPKRRTPAQPRAEGERRGRPSNRAGKTVRVAPYVDVAPAQPNTRLFASFRVISENPGITYERYLELGGDAADLGVLLGRSAVLLEG